MDISTCLGEVRFAQVFAESILHRKVPQERNFINRRWSEAQPAVNRTSSTHTSPARDDTDKVSSLRDWEQIYSSLLFFPLKSTVYKVSPLRGC